MATVKMIVSNIASDFIENA